MEHSELHQQKIQILGRLIKESSLTLEEALLLLQEEEEEQTPVTVAPLWTPGTTSPWIQPYQGTWPITTGGSTTIPLNGTITFSNTVQPTATTTYTTTTSSFAQSVLDDLTKATEDADL